MNFCIEIPSKTQRIKNTIAFESDSEEDDLKHSTHKHQCISDRFSDILESYPLGNVFMK